jgi:hypothetical protein
MLDIRTSVQRQPSEQTLHVDALNSGAEVLHGGFTVTMKGYTRTIPLAVVGDTLSFPIVLHKGDGAIWAGVRFSPEDYLHATDILAQVVDKNGLAQAEQVFNKPEEWIFVPNFDRSADSVTYWLKLIFAQANYDHPRTIPFDLIEKHVRPNDAMSIGPYGGAEIVPYVPLSISAKIVPGLIPPGFLGLGEVAFKPRDTDQTATWEFTFDR